MMVNGNRMGAMEIVHPKTLSYWEMRRKFDTRYTASSYTMIAGGDPCNQPTEKGHPRYIQKMWSGRLFSAIDMGCMFNLGVYKLGYGSYPHSWIIPGDWSPGCFHTTISVQIIQMDLYKLQCASISVAKKTVTQLQPACLLGLPQAPLANPMLISQKRAEFIYHYNIFGLLSWTDIFPGRTPLP